jgi:hypothetical protein
MNTSQIKTFAINSRQILKQGVINKISSLGFNPKGEPVIGVPTKIQGATVYAGKILDESFYDAWMALKHRIEVKGIKDVYEEAAYTWFNRLVAIRIMMKNGYIEPVLSYSSEETRIPRIVSEARAGHLITDMSANDRAKLDELLNDDSKTNEQFALLIENFCRYNPVIYNCFGGIEKYISILLPDNILAQGGFIDLLNHTTYITDEDYTKSELIGWLYQFYIAEKKDEVFESFKKGKKAEAEDIPAATQIFTPNWIVKYMVQNTVGRIYLDNNPYSELVSEMKYLVGEKTPDEAVLHLDDLADYKMIDPACGSGHILVEAFDLFYSMYREEGYSSRQAVENILKKNIIGIDLDTRAKQLATFALLMKAVKVDESLLDCRVMPRVMDMPRPYYEWTDNLRDTLPHFYLGGEKAVIDETMDAFELLTQADNLGSIMKFNISESTRTQMQIRVNEWKERGENGDEINEIIKSLELVITLTEKYTSVCANPPYMGANHMDDELLKYIKQNYSSTSNDLGAVFMDVAFGLIHAHAKFSMINQAAWLFKVAYVTYRREIIDDAEYNLDNALYLGPNTFPEIKGEVVQSVSFVVSRNSKRDTLFYYLKNANCTETKALMVSEHNCKPYSVNICSFLNFSGLQFGFWLNQSVVNTFRESPISRYGDAKQGLKTGDNSYFIRHWYEVSQNKRNIKWFPVETGGDFRKWYGNATTVLNWENDGYEIKNFKTSEGKLRSRPQGLQYSFKEGATWSTSAGERPSFRLSDNRYLFESSGSKFFLHNPVEDIYPYLAYFNSKVVRNFIEIFAPGIGVSEGAVKSLPFVSISDVGCVANECVKISRMDWDLHETSWDFKTNELIALKDEVFMSINGERQNVPTILVELLDDYKSKWSRLFNQLHSNEEELNRQFIDIYGLQDELTPDVPLDEITILQQGEISIEDNEIVWHDDVIIKQLISYAIGCWLGRYRLDKPGLHIAHPNPTSEEVCTYQYNGQNFEIDDDGIIPMMSCDSMFEDNGYNRIVEFIKVAFGEENLTENLNFIEKALGKSLEDYMIKDFWKDHKKMYQNRPIYWLFSSKKGAFQCLVYMHRMNPYTAERVRTKYLLKHIDDLKGRIATATERAALLTTVERRNLAKMQKDLDECLEYHDILHEVADKQIVLDLDDGVVVNYAKFGDVLAKIK